MVSTTSNDKVDFVLQQIETMVASEGGSLELVSAAAYTLAVRYIPNSLNFRSAPGCIGTTPPLLFMSCGRKLRNAG